MSLMQRAAILLIGLYGGFAGMGVFGEVFHHLTRFRYEDDLRGLIPVFIGFVIGAIASAQVTKHMIKRCNGDI